MVKDAEKTASKDTTEDTTAMKEVPTEEATKEPEIDEDMETVLAKDAEETALKGDAMQRKKFQQKKCKSGF